MWALQNNTSPLGMRAWLKLDSSPISIFGDTIPFSALGLGYTIARNHYIPNVAPGTHPLSVELDQFPFRSGDTILIEPGSVMWIRTVPVE